MCLQMLMPRTVILLASSVFYFVNTEPVCNPCLFNKSYVNFTAYNVEPIRYRYKVNNSNQVVRVSVQTSNATTSAPLLVVVRETRAVMSWAVPLELSNKYTYNRVSRTLCPINETIYDSAFISVEVSSASLFAVQFTLNASLIDNFYLKLGERRSLVTTPSEPQYLAFVMPDGIDTVLIKVSSSDANCMFVSIQDIQCPVFDLDTNVQFSGLYQTISTAGTLTVSREKLSQFYIVFVMKADDSTCYPDKMAVIEPSKEGSMEKRLKRIEVYIEPTISATSYIFAIAATGAVFATIYIIALGLTLFFDFKESKEKTFEKTQDMLLRLSGERSPLNSPVDSAPFYGALDAAVSENLSASAGKRKRKGNQSSESADTSGSGVLSAVEGDPTEPEVEEEYDSLPDAVLDKRIIRSKPRLYVSDLARKPYKHVGKKYTMYFWNLCTIAIFYTLPVVQLVLTYQTVVAATGKEDLCYYNFACVRPLGLVYAFNSLFSNTGYVLLGLLFLMLVRKRDLDHQKRMKACEILESNYGVPRHFGLFYSMGLALCMEGILSACYHVCPNYTNFQFDTAFMYMIAALGMLKIYQIRHPDINAHSHVAYVVMALIILIALIGVLYNSLTFWIIFSVCFLILTFMMSAEFYFKSEWKIDRAIFQRIRMEWISSRKCSFFRPSYPDRMIYLLFCNAINLTFVVLGLLKQPKDFPSFLLTIFISNLLLYLMFYIVMKLRYREKLYLRVIFFVVFACFTWAAGLFFFSQVRTSWMLTPAESRQLNGNCILFDFYDSHDVWHFLSALSLFLSFMVVLVIDDDLVYKAQETIPVF